MSDDASLVTRDDAPPVSQPSEIVTLSLLSAAGVAEQPAGAAVELLPAEQAGALSPVGVAFTLDVYGADGAAASSVDQPLQVNIDYAQLAQAYGGSFAERLTLYRVTPCAEGSEEACQNWQALAGVNDLAAQRLSVDLSANVESAGWSPQPLPPDEGAAPPAQVDPTLTQRSYLPLIAAGDEPPTVEEEIYVLAAAASSQQGSYKATPLTTVSDYQVSLATGALQTGYPIALPPAAGGLAPSVALSYDSGGVDGMTTNKNNQPGWVGLGWSLESGYITRHLKTCGVSQAPGDLCLVGGYTSTGDAYSLVLGGVASRLVQVSGTLYRLQNDPQWKVEKFSDGASGHPDAQEEYWLVTTPDGTKYRFGGEFTPVSEGGFDQNSVFYATVYNTNAAVCGSFSYDLCNKAWRWNLDRIEDANGNVVSYFYELETNFYAARNDTRTLFRKEYVRAGNLSRIEYGRRVGVNSTPPTQVIFSTEERCEGACAWPTNYPDTPGDLTCGATGSCSQNAPTFWSRKRLATITTQVFDQGASSWRNVSRSDLAYNFPTPPNDAQGDASEKKLWLNSITQRLGDGSGGLPATSFGYTMLVNRWDHNVAGVSPLTMPRLNQLTTQLGGVVSVSYGQSHPCPGGGSYIRYPHDCFPAWFTNGSSSGWTLWNKWKVTQQSSSDSFSGNETQTLSFSYSAPTWHYSDDPALPDINSCTLCPTRHWNDFRGSELVTVTDAAGAKSEHRFHRGMNGDRLSTAGGVFSASITLSDGGTRPDENWLAGQEVESRRLTATGGAKSRSVNWFTWTLTAGSGASGAHWLGTQKNESTLYATANKTSRSEFVYDSYGNVTRQILHGDTATTADDRNIERSYLTNTTAWIVDRPQWEKLWAGVGSGLAGAEQAYSQFAYDSLGFGVAPVKGNLTNLRSYWQVAPSSQYAETSTAYDTFGRPTSMTDARGKTTSTTYHPFYGYATSVTNALGHVVSTVSDPAWGVPTQLTDANGKVTNLQYDGYGRLRQVWLPGENQASEPASLEFVYDAAARPAWVQSRTLRVKASGAYLENWQYVDGFGRGIQSQTPSATGGQRIVSSQQYNALGQLLHQSSPYDLSGAAGSGYVAPLWSTVANYQRLSYDELGNQTLSETKSQSSVLWSSSALYDGWQRQTTDANGRRTDFEQNAFGQLTKVTEYNVGSIAQATNYTYDLRGGLTGVTDAVGNFTNMSYDLLGRKTAMSDPDMGSWLYQYDANGNLTGQRDARGLWLYMSYDDLNRLTTKRQDDPTSGALIADFLYDAVGQKGLLSKSRSYTAEGVVEVQNLAYDARNRPTQQQWVAPGAGGGTFRMDASFDEADRKTSLTYPGGNAGQSGEVVSYQYNAVGQLVSVSGLGGIQYVSSASYNAQGQLTQLVNEQGNGSNGLTRQWSYETNTLRLSVMRAGTAAPFENLQKLSYGYDNAGNITTLTDGTNAGQAQSFGYDWLNRLTSASTNAAGVGQYDHSYTYDAIGNITNFAGAAYTYGDPAHKHAVTAAFGNSYGYDANGNQTSRTIGGVTYIFAYDYENRLTSIAGAGVSATFLYDADGQRVKGTVNGVTTVYIAGVYEWQNGATTLYYEGNAMRRSGYASDNGVFYLLQDHLKSSSAFVTQAGVVNSHNYFFPFGGNRGGSAFSSLTTKRFTGQYHESALPGGEGLSYYGARWYDAQLGRFLSADSVIPDPDNPQAFNRYSYGLVNIQLRSLRRLSSPTIRDIYFYKPYVLNSPMNRIDPTGHYDIKPGDAHLRGTVPHEPRFLKPLRWIAAFRKAQEKVNRMYGSDLGGNLILGIALIKHDEYRMYGRTPPAGLQLTHEWYHEFGAAKRAYGPEYEITQWLSGAGPYGIPAEGVQEATQQYWARNGQDVKGESAYSYPFGASDFLEELDKALNNGEWSGSFLGSYRVEIKTIRRIDTDVSLVEYTVYNKTGWESGTRYPFPKWLRDALGLGASSRPDVERSAPGKGGTMVQTYVWRDIIHR